MRTLVVRFSSDGRRVWREVLLWLADAELDCVGDPPLAAAGVRVAQAWALPGGGRVALTEPAAAPDAAAHPGILDLTPFRECVRAGGGLWVVDDDFTPRGALPPGVPARVQVLGVDIAAGAQAAWAAAAPALAALDAAAGTRGPPPLAVYHGTSAEALAGIRHVGMQEARSGMFGAGVYTSTFFKAARFASRDQAYVLRPRGQAAVLRCLLFAERIKDVSHPQPDTPACACDRCSPPAAEVAWRASMGIVVAVEPERCQVPDHLGTWRRDGFDAIHVGVVRCAGVGVSAGGGAAEGERFVTRNEEWCSRRESVLPIHCATLDMATIDAPHYNPLQRDMRVV
jgi:hypothetical protein